DLTGAGSLANSCTGVDAGLPHQLVKAHGDSLTQVHRRVTQVFVLLHRDGEKPVTVAEFIVAQAGLLRTKDKRDSRSFRGKLVVNDCADFRERMQRMLQ